MLEQQISLFEDSIHGREPNKPKKRAASTSESDSRSRSEKGRPSEAHQLSKKKRNALKEGPAKLRLIAEELRQGLWTAKASNAEEEEKEHMCDDSEQGEAGGLINEGAVHSNGDEPRRLDSKQQRSTSDSRGGGTDNSSASGGSLNETVAQPLKTKRKSVKERARADASSTNQGGKKKKKKSKEKSGELHDDDGEDFVGFPGRWVEVESPKVKVTLLPYGVAECNYVQGQLETCQLEGCHSGRAYPECNKKKEYPKHPIDSDSLLPLPPLPPPTIRPDAHACGAAFEEEESDVRALMAAINSLQKPADCRRARLMVYYHHVSGLAAEIHKLALALSMALMTHRTLVVAEAAGWDYADPAACNQSTVRCHLASLNQRCTEQDAGDESPEILLGRCCYMNDTLITDRSRVVRVNQTTIEQHKLSLYYKTVPRRFAARGLFWWRAQLSSFIFQPLPPRRPGPGPRFGVSMHVRHDNSAEADPIPTDVYVAQATVAARMLAEASKEEGYVASLFLATDTPATEASVVEAIARHNATSAFPIAVFPEEAGERRVGTHSRRHSHQEAEDIFRALGRLADADMFVGKFSSGVSRLIAELGCVSARFRHAPVSVDRKWGVTCP